MYADYTCNVAGAMYNLLLCDDYGRIKFLTRHFGISRSTLYRKKTAFEELFKDPGRPSLGEVQLAPSLEEQLEEATRTIALLGQEVELGQERRSVEISRIRFLLIATGLSGRLIAWILRMAFDVKSNHTDILKLTQQFSSIATTLMQTYFHPCATTAAIDEVFIENLPIFIAVTPQSLLICNAGVYEKCTEKNWSSFLGEMENLTGTVSDRGRSILAAVGKLEDHSHQSDHFHCKHTIMKELRKIEARCYSLITQEEMAMKKLEKCKLAGKDARGAAAALRTASKKCTEEIELFDNLEQAVKFGFDALTLSNGLCFNSSTDARQDLDFVCEWITHIHPQWKKVISAFNDPHLLEYMDLAHEHIKGIHVDTTCILEREYILATLTRLWEEQARKRWRGKDVKIPETILTDLSRTCTNLWQVCRQLFEILENTSKSSSAVECINSRIGFFRYSKKRFSDDFANFICAIHNLTPFRDGKRKGKSPAEIENVELPTNDIFELFGVI